MIRDLWVLLAAETRMQLRQPVMVALLLLMPALGGPGLVAGAHWYMGVLDVERTPSVASQRRELPVAVPQEVTDWIEEGDALRPTTREEALAWVEARDGELVVHHDGSTRSEQAMRRLKEVIGRHQRADSRRALQQAGIEGDAVAVTSEDLAGEGVSALAVTLPTGMILVVAMAAAFVAVDVFTGERERGTLETLLSSPADRRVVVVAKLGVVIVQAAVAGLAWTGWMALAQALGWISLGVVGPGVWAVLLAASLAGAVETAAVAVVVATVSPSYRSASFLVGPAMMGVLTLAAVGSMPVELGPLGLLVPVGNLGITVRDAIAENLRLPTVLLAGAGAVVHVTIAVAVAVRLVSREGAMFASDDRQALRRAGYHGYDALLVYLVVLLATWFFGQAAQGVDLVWGMAFTQIALFGGIAVAAVSWLGLPLADTLSLRWCGWRNLALGTALGVLGPSVASSAVLLSERLLPIPTSVMEALGQLHLDASPAVAVLAFAVLPGLCEELLFRGALLGLTRRSLGPFARVLANAGLFALMHLSVHRLAPTGALGLILATLAVRSGSLWPGVVMHAVSNAIGVTATPEGLDLDPSWLLVTLPPTALAAGLLVLVRPRPVD
ncbi:MAG: CPBP family intramembrane metalloprotease [Alphaproteobacteria bacterium]|nr:CPBP family intramembrane metalloprotease [Alphaproteobacteria bacterium]